MSDIDYGKINAFEAYRRARTLSKYRNDHPHRVKSFQKMLQNTYAKRIAELEDMYPDFPEAYENFLKWRDGEED